MATKKTTKAVAPPARPGKAKAPPATRPPGDPGRAAGLIGVLCRFDPDTVVLLDAIVEALGVPRGGGGTGQRGGGRVEAIRRLIAAEAERRGLGQRKKVAAEKG